MSRRPRPKSAVMFGSKYPSRRSYIDDLIDDDDDEEDSCDEDGKQFVFVCLCFGILFIRII